MSDIHEQVREHYALAVTRAVPGTGDCCGASDGQGAVLYDATELVGLPVEAVAASMGCGDPTAIAELAPGERVLDLGSGGGIDVLLAARRVGPAGHVYGVDMTDEMLAVARANARRAGAAHGIKLLSHFGSGGGGGDGNAAKLRGQNSRDRGYDKRVVVHYQDVLHGSPTLLQPYQ